MALEFGLRFFFSKGCDQRGIPQHLVGTLLLLFLHLDSLARQYSRMSRLRRNSGEYETVRANRVAIFDTGNMGTLWFGVRWGTSIETQSVLWRKNTHTELRAPYITSWSRPRDPLTDCRSLTRFMSMESCFTTS